MTLQRSLPHDWFPVPLPDNVEIGEGSWLYSSFAFLHCRSRRTPAVQIGRSSGVYHSSFFELGPDAQVSIGDFCTLVGATIVTNGRVRIGDYCFFAHEVVIGDTPFSAPPCLRSAGGEEPAAETCIDIGNDVWVGAGAILLAGAKLGDAAVIGAAAVVDFEVPAYGVVAGNPARLIGFTPHVPAAAPLSDA